MGNSHETPGTGGRTWELAVLRWPERRAGDGDVPFRRPLRPWAVFLAGPAGGSRRDAPGEPGDDGTWWLVGEEPPETGAVAGWVEEMLCRHGDPEPGDRLLVTDPVLAAALRERIPGPPAVEVVEGPLPAAAALRDRQRTGGASPIPVVGKDPPAAAGTLRSFHEACGIFLAAAPWRFLVEEDLLRVDSPAPPEPSVQCFCVREAPLERALLFFADGREHLEYLLASDVVRPWAAALLPAEAVPVPDEEAWESLGLGPLGPGRWLPFPVRLNTRGEERPGEALLGWFDLVLRALAESSPRQVDEGRWTVLVSRAGREMPVTLSHPRVLGEDRTAVPDDPARESLRLAMATTYGRGRAGDSAAGADPADRQLRRVLEWRDRLAGEGGISPPGSLAPPGADPAEEALDIALAARESFGRKDLRLVRRALELDERCPEALRILARFEADPAEEERLLVRAAEEAAARWGVPAEAEDPGGPFPVPLLLSLRILGDLLRFYEREGRYEEALAVGERTPGRPPHGDPEGQRLVLLRAALAAGRWDRVAALAETWHRRDPEYLLAWRWARWMVDMAGRPEGEHPGPRAWRRLRQLVVAGGAIAEALAWGGDPADPRDARTALALAPGLDRLPGARRALYRVVGDPPPPGTA